MLTRRGLLLGVASSAALFAVPLPTLDRRWASASLASSYGELVVRLTTPARIGQPLPLPSGVPAWIPLEIELPLPNIIGGFGPDRPGMRRSESDFLNALDQGPLILRGHLLPELLAWDREMQLCLPLHDGRGFITAMMKRKPRPAADADRR